MELYGKRGDEGINAVFYGLKRCRDVYLCISVELK